MFILRQITESGHEANTCLGDYYAINYREINKESFDETVRLWDKEDLDSCYAVIVYEDGQSIMPLYDTCQNYIMMSNGQTFSNVSKK